MLSRAKIGGVIVAGLAVGAAAVWYWSGSAAPAEERNYSAKNTGQKCATIAPFVVATEVIGDAGLNMSIWVDGHEVTNEQFARFVDATGYVTVAEQPVDLAAYGVPVSQIPAALRKPGSAVFIPPDQVPVDVTDWWTYVPGASWKYPHGPESEQYNPGYPVVHLASEDMLAYANWSGGRLPTESEWAEIAKAGGAADEGQPAEANSWQGIFPVHNQETDGFGGLAPIGCYEPNNLGLFDVIGNVWETVVDDADPTKFIIKGGSYLCAPNYCQGYRPTSRQEQDPDFGSGNVGFRLVYDQAPSI